MLYYHVGKRVALDTAFSEFGNGGSQTGVGVIGAFGIIFKNEMK
ncbi:MULTISPECIES: hypothetical protein [unclassified Streptococcus]|nr:MULTISPECIES: hypothetical protein [unclassified Streptococcus]